MPARRDVLISALSFVLSLSLPALLTAATFTVDAAGGGDFLTIQAAVDSAATGDSILVHTGVYEEQVKVGGKDGILIKGVPGPEFVTVMGDSITLGIWAAVEPVRVEGLTLTGASGFGALFVQQSRAEFVNCIVKGNDGPGSCNGVGGGGQFTFFSDVLVENCVFEQNTSWESPGGLIVWNSRAEIRNSVFRNNSSCYGGGLEMYHCEENEPSIIEGNLFLGNSAGTWGGAILNIDSSPMIRNNTFVDNGTNTNAAIFMIGGTPEIEHNIFSGSPQAITCSSLSGYPASRPIIGANLAWDIANENQAFCTNPDTMTVEDPLFCSPESGDYSLCATSPAVEGGEAVYGAFGVGCAECTATAVEATTWGAIKARYR